MKINVTQAKKEIGTHQLFSFMTSAENLAMDGDNPWNNSEILVKGEIVNNGHVLRVVGDIHAVGRYQCNRCLDEFSTIMDIPFFEDYQEQSAINSGNELDSAYYQGDDIDITDLVRESMLLAVPIQIICTENCKGLCSQCGMNLNIGKCACVCNAIDPRFAVLQQILKNK